MKNYNGDYVTLTSGVHITDRLTKPIPMPNGLKYVQCNEMMIYWEAYAISLWIIFNLHRRSNTHWEENGTRWRRNTMKTEHDEDGTRWRRNAMKTEHDEDGTWWRRNTLKTEHIEDGSRWRRNTTKTEHDEDGTRWRRNTMTNRTRWRLNSWTSQRLGAQSFDAFFDLRLNKRLSKQSWGWWFETPSVHYVVTVMD